MAATANPKARSVINGIVVHDDRITVDGHAVPPLAALLWTQLDGRHDVAALAALATRELGVNVDADAVWLALDALADAGLLQTRIAPPTGVYPLTRRAVLHAAAALVLGRVIAADTAAAEPQVPTSIDELRSHEQRALERARSMRRAGDLDAAAQSADDAKAIRRQRLEAERQGEQNAKSRRRDEIDAARPQTPPTAAATPADGVSAEGSDVGPARKPSGRVEDVPHPEVPRATPDGFAQQEQELKRTQERNDKRQREF